MENVKRLVLISPVMDGANVQNYKIGKIVDAIYRLNLGNFLKFYVIYMYQKYRRCLITQGYPKRNYSIYVRLIKRASGEVMLKSIYTLFNNDFTPYLKRLENLPVLVADSLNEPVFIRKQSEHIRKVLKKVNSIYLHGNHEDFFLRPKKEIVKEVMDFLISGPKRSWHSLGMSDIK